MNYLKYIFLSLSLFLTSFTSLNQNEVYQNYKCMVQLKNYKGEGAYVIVSVVDKDNHYLKTLHILGNEEKWYRDLPDWWAFFEKEKLENVDAITGATIASGERTVFTFQLNENDFRTGNKLRFETAVEHKKHHVTDLEFTLESQNLKSKLEGTGYIRYVRIIPN